MDNSMLEQLVRELVSEEKIEQIIRSVVSDRLEYYFERALESKAEEMVSAFSDELITKKLDELLGRKVLINDGFGSRKEYADFESFVTDYIGRQVKNSYELERKVQQMVKERLDRYCKEVVNEANRDLTGKVFEKIAEDKGKIMF